MYFQLQVAVDLELSVMAVTTTRFREVSARVLVCLLLLSCSVTCKYCMQLPYVVTKLMHAWCTSSLLPD